ncbi:MAG: primosomal protein N', partial [Burkholderiales bacterium]|nr:primosomal protein N' [Burkholderiales bacterium]
VIVDEEHDASYKQQEGLRYSARDMAVARAKRADVPVVLGSATPSLESWHNADLGRYKHDYLRLRATPGAKPPTWRLIGTRRTPMTDGLHPTTLGAIAERLARREQTLIFLNRRGYAPVMHCSECGWLAACTRCSARLTVHLREGRLRCHHCGWEERLPPRCPGCGNADLKPLGQGTQRLEDVLAARFPHARVMRIDRDSTRRKGSFEKALEAIHDGRIDILVGTQMLAKGHDFPRLTLVVVTGADSGLYSADYRAAERLYAQLAQVAGRAGRAEHPGEVLVQTDFPEHPLYQALLADDYDAFARGELSERQLAGFPPYLHQAVLRAEAAKLEEALTFLCKAVTLAPVVEGVTVWDPVPATMTRLANRERAQVLVQSHSRPRLQSMLAAWMAALRQERAGKIRWSLDVDPLEL